MLLAQSGIGGEGDACWYVGGEVESVGPGAQAWVGGEGEEEEEPVEVKVEFEVENCRGRELSRSRNVKVENCRELSRSRPRSRMVEVDVGNVGVEVKSYRGRGGEWSRIVENCRGGGGGVVVGGGGGVVVGEGRRCSRR